MIFEIAGWPTRNWRAAPVKEPVSTTRTKASMAVSRFIIIPFWNDEYIHAVAFAVNKP